MKEFTDISSLEKLSEEIIVKNVNLVFLTLLDEIKLSLNLDPYYLNINIKITKPKPSKDQELNDIFDIGVKRFIQNNILIIEINENYKGFIKFILLREIYNLFIPKELQKYNVVKIVVNQIIISNLSKETNLNEWRTLIRSKLKQYNSLTKGFSRLFSFDSLEGFFKFQEMEDSYTPIQFFFFYLRTNKSLISDNIEEFYDIFLYEFTNYISRSMINDEIIETIRCLIYIFYKVKRYRDLLSYRQHFQEFKENGEINSNLSLRKFTKNMNWIKKYSFIAPSYQLNWNTINVCVIALFLRFNPKLKKAPILRIIENLPFFSTLKISISNFSVDLCGYVIIPNNFLNDFINFIKRLKSFNIIINQYCLLRMSQKHMINLNYFREYKQNNLIINPNHRAYDKNYELEFQIDFENKFYNQELSILDFLIIDRIRHFSVGGLGFETRTETINLIKSDLINEIISQRTIFKNLKKILTSFHNSNDLKTEFLQLIKKNKKFGFFFIKRQLEVYLYILDLFEDLINKNPTITNHSKFRNFIIKQNISHLIEDNIKFKSRSSNITVFKDIISTYFKSKENYRQEVQKLRKFYDLVNSCYNLKIFNFENIENILINQNIIKTIFKIKEEKLEKFYEKIRVDSIKAQQINDIIDKFLNNDPPIIAPLLINTIITKRFFKDFLQLILVDSEKTLELLDQIKIFFPRILIHKTKDLISNENYIYVEISTPKLNTREKKLLFSIIYNNFKDKIIYCKNYLWSGIVDALSSKNFYDFENYKFFYTKDLYEQYFLYVQRVLGDDLKLITENSNKNQAFFWSKRKDIMNLVKKVNKRIKSENYEFNITDIDKLLIFYLDLNKNLLDEKGFIQIKQEYFFANYIKSIKFIPAFQYFNLSQYYLYLYPSDINEIDFKLLLLNTFQKIKFPACIDNSNPFFIKYIMPYGNPNKAYLNWLVKSKKVIREYCGFFIKKVYHLFHFNINITSEGWVYSPDRFKAHMQNILFNKDYDFQTPEIKEFNLSDRKETSHFGPNSTEFESLSKIYNWRSLDIKSYLGTLKYYPTENFTDLIKKDLIFPYLTLKNLDLQDKLYIIIPDLKEELYRTLINIFSFFNYGFIYETEGEYYIDGFTEEIQFKNGLMIKLYLPDCELSEFIRVFDLLFEYLEIKDYLILNDLVDGSNLLKSVFGGLKFLDSYNPLKNLIWNEKGKVWENHKLFTPKFEPIYPDLIEKK